MRRVSHATRAARRSPLLWLASLGAPALSWAAIVLPPAAPPVAPVAPAAPAASSAGVSGAAPTTLQNSIQWKAPQAGRGPELSAQALAGDVDAMVALGYHFHTHPDLPQARAQALKWWKQAAEAGDARAMAAYGYLLSGAAGGTRFLSTARQWLQRAQAMGLVRATYLLALAEAATNGPRQKARAMTLLEQAAKAGDAYAMNDLGVERELAGDAGGAADLYGRAATAGVARARQNLQRLQANPKGQDAALLQRLRTLADDGNADALLEMAQRYHLGQGVQTDYAQAISYYRRAANAGSTQAREFLALIFSRSGEAQGAAIDGAWMQQLAGRIHAAALWSQARNAARPLDRPARIDDPLADLI